MARRSIPRPWMMFWVRDLDGQTQVHHQVDVAGLQGDVLLRNLRRQLAGPERGAVHPDHGAYRGAGRGGDDLQAAAHLFEEGTSGGEADPRIVSSGMASK